MAFAQSYEIEPDFAILGSRRRPGRAIVPSVQFVVAHDTGNPGASARAHARWYRNDPNPARISSAHIFVDDKSIVETVPALSNGKPPEQALHVLYSVPSDNQLYGVDANRAAVGIEYCYGGSIDPDEAYSRYVWTIAYACDKFGLDPARRVVGHHVLDPQRKSDPSQGLRASGRSYDTLLRDVVAAYRACGGDASRIESARIRPGRAAATVHLHRRDRPTLSGSKLGKLAPHSEVDVVSVVKGDLVAGNDDWCELADRGGFCWSGGLTQR
jgi:hypothetical protein